LTLFWFFFEIDFDFISEIYCVEIGLYLLNEITFNK